ncbi:antichymotrypsin-1-like isoform X3 [Maniola jurtina]|uniref:antichymotrypsin-1-like isoform X3 n=1 Tax=Maniola jurtina TaxID=191418 RepID=UPI001E68DBAB|nr:antichymotrypsin-1-like isoform X3 [Maniola jurtina]
MSNDESALIKVKVKQFNCKIVINRESAKIVELVIIALLKFICQFDLDIRVSNMGTIILVLMATMAGVAHSQFGDFTFPSYTRSALGDSVDIASMKFLKETYNSAADKSIVSSPLGILTLLALYSSGAEGENRDEIVRYLGAADYKQLEASYESLSQRYASMDRSYLTVANKVFVSDKYTLRDQFKLAASAYRSDVEAINFENTKLAADAMNQWSASNTNGKISSPVSEDDIDPQAAAALLNVIFFQGHWHVPFNASETKEKEFRLDSSNSVKKPMMHLLQSLFYYESPELGAKMIELPYKESQFRMIVVLPDDVNGLQSVVEKAAQRGLLDDVYKMGPAGADIDLDMPKFEIKSKLNLNDLLPKVGVSRIFSEAAPGIIKEQGVAVSRGLQEAFVKVDEEGATAGAFTGFVAIPISLNSRPPPPIPFKVDHPFLFAILHNDIVLFTGTYAH